MHLVILGLEKFLSMEMCKIFNFFLDDEPWMVRPTLIDLNPVELNYYSFMISLDECSGSCMFYLQNYVFQKKQKK